MANTCANCQSPVLESQRFCRYCGHRLDQGFQDYIETEHVDRAASSAPPPVRESSARPIWSSLEGRKTTRLKRRTFRPESSCGSAGGFCFSTALLDGRARRSRRPFWAVTLVLLLALGVGAFRTYQWQTSRAGEEVAVVESEPGAGAAIDLSPPAAPEPPEGPELPRQPTLAPTPPAEPAPVSREQIQQRIGRLLSDQAARIQRNIEPLRQRLDEAGALSEADRQKLLDQIDRLERERLGLLAAAQALKSEALQDFVPDIVPLEDILRELEAELKRQNITVDIEGLDKLMNQR